MLVHARFVNSEGRYAKMCARRVARGDVYTYDKFQTARPETVPADTLRILYTVRLKRGPKDFIYTFCPSRRVDVSFRDEIVYSVNITWWVAQWNLIIVYRFGSAKVFDNSQRGVKGTRRVVSGPKETDNIIVVVDGVTGDVAVSPSGDVEMGNELWSF